MKHCSSLGSVDFLAGEHGLNFLSQPCLASQFYEQGNRISGDAILGVIEENIASPETRLTPGIMSSPSTKMGLLERLRKAT